MSVVLKVDKMTQQVNNAAIQKKTESNLQINERKQFSVYENLIDEFVAMGPSIAYISNFKKAQIAKEWGITPEELDGCIRLARKQINTNQAEIDKQNNASHEVLNGECAYYYAQGYTKYENSTNPNDGMGSLSALGSYNRLMFGIKS
jgi:hypothetical protein